MGGVFAAWNKCGGVAWRKGVWRVWRGGKGCGVVERSVAGVAGCGPRRWHDVPCLATHHASQTGTDTSGTTVPPDTSQSVRSAPVPGDASSLLRLLRPFASFAPNRRRDQEIHLDPRFPG